MDKKENLMPKLGLISLGCAKNMVNCEQMMALCRDAGMELCPSPEGCDAAVVNTCGFLSSAKPLRPRPSKPFWRPPRTSRPAI